MICRIELLHASRIDGENLFVACETGATRRLTVAESPTPIA